MGAKQLSDLEAERFARDGYLIRRGLIEPDMVSMLAVLTVDRTNGTLWSVADCARYSQALGHMSPCSPTGAIPNGAS